MLAGCRRGGRAVAGAARARRPAARRPLRRADLAGVGERGAAADPAARRRWGREPASRSRSDDRRERVGRAGRPSRTPRQGAAAGRRPRPPGTTPRRPGSSPTTSSPSARSGSSSTPAAWRRRHTEGLRDGVADPRRRVGPGARRHRASSSACRTSARATGSTAPTVGSGSRWCCGATAAGRGGSLGLHLSGPIPEGVP